MAYLRKKYFCLVVSIVVLAWDCPLRAIWNKQMRRLFLCSMDVIELHITADSVLYVEKYPLSEFGVAFSLFWFHPEDIV